MPRSLDRAGRAHHRRPRPAGDARPHQRPFPFARQPDEGLPARHAARTVHAARGAAAGRCRRRAIAWPTCARSSARWRCCAGASPRARRRLPRARRHARIGIDAIMQAYADVGIRATVAIDQPNVVEYDKYPYLEELLSPEQRAAMDAAPRQSSAELLALYAHLIERWHGAADGRLAAAVSCSAPQRVTRRLLRWPVGAVEAARPAVQHPHPRDEAAARAGRRKYGKSLVRARARPGPARRTHDGDPRDLDRRRTTSSCWPVGLHRGPQPGLQPAPGQRRDALARAARRRRADVPGHRRDEHRRHGQPVGGRQDRGAAADADRRR